MKRKIKQEIFSLRDSHLKKDQLRKSTMIAERLFLLPEFQKADTLMLYSSIKNEVDTAEIIKLAIKSKRVALPVTKDHYITAVEFTPATTLKPGKFGILEPVDSIPLKPDEIDIVVVPGIAFDHCGNRVGYGHGCYDKFFMDIDIFKVALAYDLQLVESIPNDPHDIPMDAIVTESKTIRCAK